jgi:hypothetical protein
MRTRPVNGNDRQKARRSGHWIRYGDWSPTGDDGRGIGCLRRQRLIDGIGNANSKFSVRGLGPSPSQRHGRHHDSPAHESKIQDQKSS